MIEYRSMTEALAFQAAHRAHWMKWRIKSWGYPAMTPREYEAVTLERMFRHDSRTLSPIQIQGHAEALATAIWKSDRAKIDDARRSLEEALEDLSRAERGIQSKVASYMEISRPTVHALLARGSKVMQYFADQHEYAYGWRLSSDNVWWLAVPIAPIDPISRRKHKEAN